MKIGFIGLGVMGGPIAGHMVAAGHDVVGFNRGRDKARIWARDHGAGVADSAAEAGAGRELVVLCVGTDQDVRDVVAEIGPRMRPGAAIVDHTTTSASLAGDMAVLAKTGGWGFVDAPVSGGEAGAQKGQLSIMVGGEAEAVRLAEPVMRCYAKAIVHMGGPGAGQLTKMVNQICIAGVVQGLAEAVGFAARSGLDADLVYQAISQGAAQSWQMDNRWASMCRGEFDFGFAVDWMRKDLGLVLGEARANGARLELTALVDQFYAEVQQMGGRRWDTSSLAARLSARRDTAVSPEH